MQTKIRRMIHKNRLSTLFLRTAALGVFAAAATLGLEAQPTPAATPAQPTVNLQASLMAPLDFSSSSSSLSSSSSDAAPATEFHSFSSEATQPPPRRRYRRPNYSDSHTNPDGSPKYTFAIGGGLTLPTGDTHKYLKTSYTFQVGAGRNFNKTFGVLAQFDWANFGFQDSTLRNQQALYNGNLDPSDPNYIARLNGNSHVWSFSINPIVNYYTSDTWGAYAIGGVGFYHKIADFTVPAIGTYCDPYYGYCYQYQANQTIDHYTSNAPGFSGGLGFTRKFSRFSSGKIYAEARYVWVANQRRDFSFANYNYYPPNSYRTSYIPITFGFRW